MGGIDNYGADDLYNMEDVWNEKAYDTKIPKKVIKRCLTISPIVFSFVISEIKRIHSRQQHVKFVRQLAIRMEWVLLQRVLRKQSRKYSKRIRASKVRLRH